MEYTMKKIKWIFLVAIFLLAIVNLFLISSSNAEEFMNGNKNEIDSASASTIETISQFNEAFNKHDVDAIMNLMTDDCVFDNTRPAPDGERIEGAEAVRKAWEELFRRSPQAHFETEEIFAAGNRAFVLWIYTWVKDGKKGHVRGVDIFKVKNRKVAEKLSYVKG